MEPGFRPGTIKAKVEYKATIKQAGGNSFSDIGFQNGINTIVRTSHTSTPDCRPQNLLQCNNRPEALKYVKSSGEIWIKAGELKGAQCKKTPTL